MKDKALKKQKAGSLSPEDRAVLIIGAAAIYVPAERWDLLEKKILEQIEAAISDYLRKAKP